MNSNKEPRERLIVAGAGKLTDAELLAVIIREGSENLTAAGLAEKIIADFPGGLGRTCHGGCFTHPPRRGVRNSACRLDRRRHRIGAPRRSRTRTRSERDIV
jgi:DNA repair protein RadC